MTIPLQHASYVAGAWVDPAGPEFRSQNPRTKELLATYRSCARPEVDKAMALATTAFQRYRALSRHQVAQFLRIIAAEIESLGDQLLEVAEEETGLGLPRLQGERGRTCGQLRAFAQIVEDGHWVQASIDTALLDRQPLPKPDIRRMLRPIGPVVVFGASNFPFAFSTVGGDTASALAAGCPVIVKGHPSHPATSELFAHAVARAVKICDRVPAGVFSLLQGVTDELGAELIRHPETRAVGFTGSLQGGRALMDLAASRPVPIPVYAEMGSINPVFICRQALATRGREIAAGLADSVTMGTGQFCTSPGVVVTLADRAFETALQDALAAKPRGTLLNERIADSLAAAVESMARRENLELLSGDEAGDTGDGFSAAAYLFKTDAVSFLVDPRLGEEVFGPVTVLVECHNEEQMADVARRLNGNLTATVHAADGDAAAELLEILEQKVGRVIFNGFPTGVEVCPSMQHGGPYPAASLAATSVGADAMVRFARFVAYQNLPDALLPAALQNDNPQGLWRKLDGELSQRPVTEAPER